MGQDRSKKGGLKRRDFLKNGAAAGAGAALGAGGALAGVNAQGTAQGAITTWHRQADIIVVGSGAAGLPAAIRARDHNVSVLVIEENFDIGGHGIISLGNIALG